MNNNKLIANEYNLDENTNYPRDDSNAFIFCVIELKYINRFLFLFYYEYYNTSKSIYSTLSWHTVPPIILSYIVT